MTQRKPAPQPHPPKRRGEGGGGKVNSGHFLVVVYLLQLIIYLR